MGKTAVDKNCFICRVSLPFLWKLPLRSHVTMVTTGASRAELHSVATADWSWSIHLTQAEPIKIFPTSNFGSEREKAVTLQMAAFPQCGGSQSAEKM